MKAAVRASELATLLDDGLPVGVRILSLDCFDTLLWRNVHAPVDVFADLPVPGGALEARGRAERAARKARHDRDGREEVHIEAIYDHMFAASAAADRAATLAAELAAEARHCYAFAPTVALIEAARRRGLTVIVTSDTYLSAEQLRALIAQAAGEDVAAAIDRIFCSCEHGMSKGQGLFEVVLDTLDIAPGTILHVGDNRVADAVAPRALGIHAVHFEQFAPGAEQQLRLEAAAAALVDPATRISVPALQPHRPAIALRGVGNIVDALGHDVLGPVMHGFAEWIRDEAAALAEATGRPVKTLFLLRDGYLPQRMFAAAGCGDAGAIEISRFTARRASFVDADAIREYLLEEDTERVEVLGRQLNLDPSEIKRLGRDHKAFRRAVLTEPWIKRICARSRAFADRMAQHVRAAGVASGDCVMLVDLGYNGTVQNLVEDVLVDRLGVAVAGRYLLLRERHPSGRDKRGLLDVRHYDARLLMTLSRSVAILEQLSTAAQGSVVDYRADGRPVRKAPGAKGAQSEIREAVQAACLEYAASVAAAKHRPAGSDGPDAMRRTVAAVLTRLLFLPRSEEVALFEQFDHDVNLGTSDMVKMIDADAAAAGMRHRGLTYLNGVQRMYLAGEVQGHGLPLMLSLLSVGRFGLDLRHGDFRVGAIDVPVLLANASGQTMTIAQAYPTHDGFYLLTVPAKVGGFAIGVQIGAVAEVVQIEDVAFHRIASLTGHDELRRGHDAGAVLDGMETLAPGLHRCGEEALIFTPPPTVATAEPLALAIVFRPVVRRIATAAASLRKAA